MPIDDVPNQGKFKTNGANNSFMPLTRGPSTANPPNLSRLMHGDPGGSANMTKMASPIVPPNGGIFRDGDKGVSATSPTPAAVQPGKPAIPTNPFLVSGGIQPAARQPDNAKTMNK